ncbi:MAG: restriction endonuclease subunit S [Winogradskyella sp.]|uniref:restriction endonuclease subunit S n=1 Tax=Winogradskyella sp. TaxID=1883156 RepID=UPI0025F8EE0A|nr:restriction endonuclease subunit S [Winogradskyella sp.]NRB60305.1 restriction endonuclease subunit S [Winogradskyella sp.]
MQKEKLLVPKLRFSDFNEEFELKLFDEISDITRLAGYEYSKYWVEDDKKEIIALRGYNIGKGKLELNKLSYISNSLSLQLKRSRLSIGDIVYPCVGSIGNAVVIEENDKYHIQQNIAKITCRENVYPYYLVQFLISDYGLKEVYRFNASGAQPNVLVGSLRKYRIILPSLEEQQKIANFLSAIDTRTQTLDKKKALLEQYKKGVMQQIFKQEIRFKDEDGNAFPEWETLPLKKVFSRSKDKNKNDKISLVLTNSATQGIVSQNAYFDKDIANSSNLSGYYIVKTDDFIYNPRISQSAPVGPLNRNKLSTGVMSPLYTVLNHLRGNIDFLEIYFKSSHWHRYMKSIANYGARHDRMNVTTTDFENMPIPFPCIEEQQKIAQFLMAIDTQINTVAETLEATKTYKTGLLQQMFV